MPNMPFRKTARDIFNQCKSSGLILSGMMAGSRPAENNKEQILDVIGELVQAFLCYDRQADQDLPEGIIEDNIASGKITVDEITEAFRIALLENLPDE